MEEIGDAWIVAVAKDSHFLEVWPVMAHLKFYVREARVPLVVLSSLRAPETAVVVPGHLKASLVGLLEALGSL